MRFQISIRLTELVIAEPAAPVGRQGGGVYGFQHQMPLGVDEGTFALGVGTPKEENEVFFFLGNDFDDGIGEGFPTFVLMWTSLMGSHGQRGVE